MGTFPRTEDDVVLMEWWFSFTPNETSEMTEKQKLTRVNPKIILSVRLGKGFASAVMPVLLEAMTFSDHMKICKKLMTNFPHVQLVDSSFMEKLYFGHVLKPIGGETFGFDVNNVRSIDQCLFLLNDGFGLDSRLVNLHSPHGPQHLRHDDVRPQRLPARPRADALGRAYR